LIGELLERLGRPQDSFRALHVAGTRGKGSTCALLSAALEAAGIPAGLTTSPNLVAITERIRLSDRDCREDELCGWLATVREASAELEPSYFEALMAAAFLAFAESGVPLAVVEVGLGGRLDASVLCRPVVTAVAKLGLEHRDRLGDTIEEIAREKAGIFKPGVPALLSPNAPEAVAVVRAHAAEVGAPLREIAGAELASAPACGLPGIVQRENAALAWAMLEELALVEPRWTVSRAQAEQGFAAVRWPGRLDRRRSEAGVPVLVDVAHDAASVRALVEAVEAAGDRPATLVFTCLSDKDLPEMAELLAASSAMRAAVVLVPEVEHPRSRPAAEVVAALGTAGLSARVRDSVGTALTEALSGGGLVVAFGTFAVAGGVLELLPPAA
jgi:dihydrofolate synthase/folylpolyglutamate synthase